MFRALGFSLAITGQPSSRLYSSCESLFFRKLGSQPNQLVDLVWCLDQRDVRVIALLALHISHTNAHILDQSAKGAAVLIFVFMGCLASLEILASNTVDDHLPG
ncbi:hypothetical protein [Oricola sp.]|uniref:hypothetical protein n=1 Tax=Oricola sp. TaxID=1979950 RepID=UPI003BA958D6